MSTPPELPPARRLARHALAPFRPLAAPFLHRLEWRVARGIERSALPTSVRGLADQLGGVTSDLGRVPQQLDELTSNLGRMTSHQEEIRAALAEITLRLDVAALGHLRSTAFDAAIAELRGALARVEASLAPGTPRTEAGAAAPGAARRAVIVGAGGHAKVVLDALAAAGGFEVVGLVDPAAAEPAVLGVPVLGGDERLPELLAEGVTDAVVALGSNRVREKVGDHLRTLGYRLPAIVHPSALVSPTARIGDGSVVMARAVVGTLAEVGELAIVNTGSVVEHDNRIGRAAHVAPGVTLAGNVVVGDRALVGAGAAARPGVRIGADAVVGAASAVVADVAAGTVVGGAPARPLRKRTAPG